MTENSHFSRPAETDPLQRLVLYNDEDDIVECPTQGLRKWFGHASSHSTKLAWSAQSHTTTENRIKYVSELVSECYFWTQRVTFEP